MSMNCFGVLFVIITIVDIDRLQKLKDNGAIDEKEFEIEKQKILTDDSEKNTKKINVKKIKIKRWQIIVAAIVIVSVVIIWNDSTRSTGNYG